MRSLVCAVAILCGMATGAGAVCKGKFVGVTAQTPLTYSPFASWNATQQLVVSVQNTGNTACAFQLSLAASSYPLQFGGKLNFSLQAGSSAAGQSQNFSVVTQTVKASETIKLNVSVVVFRGQAVLSGQMAAAPAFVLTVADPAGQQPPQDQVLVPLLCTIPPIFEVNIAGSGQFATLQFGQLAANSSSTIILNTRATGNHTLEFRSLNGGNLLPLGRSAKAIPIPYTLTMDGQPINLAVPATVQILSGAGEAARRLNITIGSMTGTLAGIHSDTVTVRIASSL